VYRSTSESEAWPVIEAMIFDEQPISASVRAAAFRKPWATQRCSSPAVSM